MRLLVDVVYGGPNPDFRDKVTSALEAAIAKSPSIERSLTASQIESEHRDALYEVIISGQK